LLTTDQERSIDAAFFEARIRAAHALRASFYQDATHYRVIFSESDGLPGTIVDRYGDVLTWTCICAGMEQRRDLVLDVLAELYNPSAIIERNDSWLRGKDDLESRKSVLRGSYAGPIVIEEGGLQFHVDVLDGPKTGFFMDQRHHRVVTSRFASDRRVLGVFCADGGFGLLAAARGAASVHFIDSAGRALARVKENAARNGIETPLTFEEADALERLGELVEEKRSFDLIALDPPAFAKSRRHVESATKAYQRLNINAFQLLSDEGILATSACSQAVRESDFLKIVHYSARRAGVTLRLLYRGCQPPDHPVLDAMPETQYLKFYIFQKMPA
jgi:23S rRNA (cytosine1962-C5)-methyltransferase